MKIDALQSGTGLNQTFGGTKGAPAAAPTESFSKVMGEMIAQVNANQQAADSAIQSLATGESKGLHEVMIAVEKSNVSFQFLAQVKTKVVDAYQEIMRMPV
jgi:flagellar hook-basal body complex protein FliE